MKTKKENFKREMKTLNVNELFKIRGGNGMPTPKEFDPR